MFFYQIYSPQTPIKNKLIFIFVFSKIIYIYIYIYIYINTFISLA